MLLLIDDAKFKAYAEQLNRIELKLDAVIVSTRKMETNMSALDDAVVALGTQVQANTDAEASAIDLIRQLADLITANATDPAAVNALADKLRSSADALAAAILANTPSSGA
jgi:prefoldin subunit 5